MIKKKEMKSNIKHGVSLVIIKKENDISFKKDKSIKIKDFRFGRTRIKIN